MGKERELLSDVSAAYNLEKQYDAQNVYGTKSTTPEILASWKPVSGIPPSATNSVSDIESQMSSNTSESVLESVSEVEFDDYDWHGELATLVNNLKRETKFLHNKAQ